MPVAPNAFGEDAFAAANATEES
jgi:hypothetical protein